ncbi:MAG TPA: energy transducer TonB [Xanthobacteraceae bacterium]|jgi:protein TonB
MPPISAVAKENLSVWRERSARAITAAVLLAVSVAAGFAQPAPQQAPAATPGSAPSPQASPPPASSPAMAAWQLALLARLDHFKRYPAQARGAQGVVSLAFRIDRQGKVVNSHIVTSSGSAVLDAEALALIKRASPVPRPPTEIKDDDLSIVVPIRYTANNKD